MFYSWKDSKTYRITVYIAFIEISDLYTIKYPIWSAAIVYSKRSNGN